MKLAEPSNRRPPQTCWREALETALDLDHPSLLNFEWLLDRIEGDDRVGSWR